MELRILRLKLRDLVRSPGKLGEALRPQIVRTRDPYPLADNRSHHDLRVTFGYILMDAVIGETREVIVLLQEQNFRLIRRRRLHHRVRHFFEPHRNTPTLTLRNRAGDAPWPVPITCPG